MKTQTLEQILPDIKKTLQTNHASEFQLVIDEFQPYDLARIHNLLSDIEQNQLLELLNDEQLADMMQEMDYPLQIEILAKLSKDRTTVIINLMDNDDLAILLEELSPEQKDALIRGMSAEESRFIRNMMKYPPETAGRIMTNRYVWIPQHYTVTEVVQKLKTYVSITETINYLYVVDDDKQLIGVVSFRGLILAEPDAAIVDIMHTRSMPYRWTQTRKKSRGSFSNTISLRFLWSNKTTSWSASLPSMIYSMSSSRKRMRISVK